MKLALSGQSIMLTASLLLLAGCKQKSGFDQLTAQMENAKGIKSQYVVQVPGQKDVVVDCLYTKPDRVIMTSKDFVIGTNPLDGHFESSFAEKEYDVMPWDGNLYPGTGRVVQTYFAQAGPATGINPAHFSPSFKWKFQKKVDGVESYVKEIQTMAGVDRFELFVDSKGKPVKMTAPGDATYLIKSFEIVDEQPIEKFRVEPKEGFVCIRTPLDRLALQIGQKFEWTRFKAASDMNQFKPGEHTLFAIVDPAEATSVSTMKWLATPGANYKKVSISKGNATTGLFDPTGADIDLITTTTPVFVMIDKDSKITSMWIGFDADGIPAFEKDIQKALEEHP